MAIQFLTFHENLIRFLAPIRSNILYVGQPFDTPDVFPIFVVSITVFSN